MAAYGGYRPLALGRGPSSGGLAGEGTPGAGLRGGGPLGGGPLGGGMGGVGPPGGGLRGEGPLGGRATAESLMAKVWADLTAAEGLAEDGKLGGGFTAGCHSGKSRSEADVAGSTEAEEDPVLNIGPRDPCMRQQV